MEIAKTMDTLSKIFSSYQVLLIMLLLMFLQPLADMYASGRLFFSIMMSVIVLFGMTCIHSNTKHRNFTLFLAIVTIAARWLEHTYLEHRFAVISCNIILAVFITITSLFSLDHILKTKTVTRETLAAAISGYIMMGMVFAIIFFIIDIIHPNSFLLPPGCVPALEAHDARTYFYISFVTLTTVGFGDSVPISPLARSFTLLEAIFGQLFIAVLIASLVGKKIASFTK